MAESENDREIADPVAATIHTIAELHARSEQRVDRPQRAVEAVTALLGRPGFLYFSMGFVVLWIAANLLLRGSGRAAFDPPPFTWLQGLVSVTALFATTTVLITQRRQDRIAERREQLDLQISLLVE